MIVSQLLVGFVMSHITRYPLLSVLFRWLFSAKLQLKLGSQAMPQPKTDSASLYLHIPFCESLCTYCSFHRQIINEPLAREYFQALRKDIRRNHALGNYFSQVYFGGGTPTVLIDELLSTIELVNSLFNEPSVSVETNPNHLIDEKMSLLQQAGISRLSVGVQSFDDLLLSKMNRLQPYGNAAQIIDRLQKYNDTFPTFNVDMIFNLPGQTDSSLESDLTLLTNIPVKQISWYPLMPVRSNLSIMKTQMGKYRPQNEASMYQAILKKMNSTYHQSSVWCFSLNANNKSVDEYITVNDQYLGLGSGTLSSQGQTLFAKTFSISDYIRDVELDSSSVVATREFSDTEWLSLRLLISMYALNLDKKSLFQGLNSKLTRLLVVELSIMKKFGFIEEHSSQYKVTDNGKYLALVLMKETLMAVNRLRQTIMNLPSESEQILVKG